MGGFTVPNRIIREGWLESEAINSLSPIAERFFLRLCLKADDFGRFHANPQLLKSNLFPLKDDVRGADMSRCLAECEEAGLVRCYGHDSKRYVVVPKFGQRTRASVSKFPEPPDVSQAPAECLTHVGHVSDMCQTQVRQPRTYSETETETDAEAGVPARAGDSVAVGVVHSQPPTPEQVEAYGVPAGVSAAYCREWHGIMANQDWRDNAGRPCVHRWRNLLTKYWQTKVADEFQAAGGPPAVRRRGDGLAIGQKHHQADDLVVEPANKRLCL